MKPITTTASKVNTIYWQQVDHDEGVGEPALLVEAYSNTISIEQEGNAIRLNYETLPELAKHFNRLAREKAMGNL